MTYLDWLPLAHENIDSIRTRIDADLNAGVDSTEPGYIDTTEGGFAWDLTQAPALEIERLWDFLASEVPAAMFIPFAWGRYLDLHGELVSLTRKAATKASGLEVFEGTNGTVIPIGTQVVQASTDPTVDPLAFQTTAAGTISGGQVILPIEAVVAGSAGNLAASSISVPPDLDGIDFVLNDAALTGGTDDETDESFRERILLEWSAASGAGTVADYKRWALSTSGIGYVTVEPITNAAGVTPSPGNVRVTITDTFNHPVSLSVLYAFQDDIDPPAHKCSLTGTTTMSSGTITVDTTAGFAPLGSIRWMPGTTVQDISYTGKTSTTFTGCTGGSGTGHAGDRIAQGFDQGNGKAPIGHNVAIQTVSQVSVAVVASIVAVDGFSADGSNGTTSLYASIAKAIQNYIDVLRPGDDVVLAHVEAQFFRVPGVYDVTSLTLNGVAGNVAIASNQVALTGNLTLS